MRVLALLLGAALTGCTSNAVVTRGGGESLQAAQSEATQGGKYRIAVGRIIDKSGASGERSVTTQIQRINQDRGEAEAMTEDGVLLGVQDMLVTELFGSEKFIVLERAGLDAVITEQEFSRSVRAGDATAIPDKQLEGAELIVLGAITAFDAGVEGGALPIPIPLGDRGDFGVLKLAFSRGYVAMDLRVVDARTGRVLSSVAVEGRNSRFGMDFGVRLRGRHHSANLPGILRYFQNTPVEKALQEMTIAAVDHIAQRIP